MPPTARRYLAHLGTDLDKADAWPSDRGQRSLKQLIKDCAAPDPDIVWDKRSPAQALPAFCIDTHDQPVYVRRSRPFKYEIGNLAQAESASKAKGLT